MVERFVLLELIKDADYDSSVRCSLSFFLERFSHHRQECRVTSKFHTRCSRLTIPPISSLLGESAVSFSVSKSKCCFYACNINTISQEQLEGISSNLLQMFAMYLFIYFFSERDFARAAQPCFLLTLNQAALA